MFFADFWNPHPAERLVRVLPVSCSPAGTMLTIEVRDTGRGIREQDLPRLFTPFDRLGVQDTGIEGTGVGLALSHRLMTAMGGTLTATSRGGVGSAFIAAIPAIADPPIAGHRSPDLPVTNHRAQQPAETPPTPTRTLL